MGREIKFRLWDKFYQEFVPNNVFFVNSDEKQVAVCTKSWKIVEQGDIWYDFHCDLLQYTGLRDKNGTAIYEGDIIKTELGIGYVIWSDAAFAIKSPGSEAVDWVHSSVYEESEVIGNIYENPELLKEEKNA